MSNIKTRVWEDVDESLLDAMDKDAEAFAGPPEFMKLKECKNTVRFLPPLKDSGIKTHVIQVHQHFVKVPGKEASLRFACPRIATKGKRRCPVCEEANRLSREGNSLDRDAAYEKQAKLRYYANVLDRNAPGDGPKILGFGPMIWEQLKVIREEHGAYWNPGPEGRDIHIRRKGSGRLDTEYILSAADCSPLHEDDDQADDWLSMLRDLNKYTQLIEPDRLLDALNGKPREERRVNAQRKPAALPPGKKTSAKARRTVQDDVQTLDAEFTETDEEPEDGEVDDSDIPF